jgi:hypothetical protein
MKKNLATLLCVAVLCLATSVRGLTIVPTFDSSIVNDPNGTAMMNAINAAIQVLQSNLVDNVTVNVTFVADETVGLGQSSTFGGNVLYASFLAALSSHATSANDTKALNTLPLSATDPVIGGTQIHLTSAQSRLLGLGSYSGTDSTISLKMSLMNLTRPPADPTKYDLQQVVEHELDEVLGISSGLPDMSVVWPVDLFRYTTNLVRTFTTNGDNAYFSIDATHLIARYNMDPGGDYGDWWSINYPTNWSPVTGLTLYYPQVQDAFSGPDVAIDVGTAELTALDVVGWTLASAVSPNPRPTLAIAPNGTNHFTLSWPGTYSGFVLQESTNLTTGGWTASASGSTNPAVVAASGLWKFYRLYETTGLPTVTAPTVALQGLAAPIWQVTTRVYQPRHP